MAQQSPLIPVSVKEAKEQAAEYFGFTASKFIQVEGGKVFEIPNPGLLNDDQQERWENLQFELEKCDRDPSIDIPEQKLEDGTVFPARTIPGEVLSPYRLNGELIKPTYSVRLAKVLWGDEGYAEYKAGGGISNQISLEWSRMAREFQARVEQDPKSNDGPPTLEVVQ